MRSLILTNTLVPNNCFRKMTDGSFHSVCPAPNCLIVVTPGPDRSCTREEPVFTLPNVAAKIAWPTLLRAAALSTRVRFAIFMEIYTPFVRITEPWMIGRSLRHLLPHFHEYHARTRPWNNRCRAECFLWRGFAKSWARDGGKFAAKL